MSYDMLGRMVTAFMKLGEELQGLVVAFVEKFVNSRPEWVEETKKFLRKEPCWTKWSSIGPLGFFATRPGLEVSLSFARFILAPAFITPETPPASFGEAYRLRATYTSDQEVLEKLGHKIFENPRAFLKTLARLIDEQWGGEEGILPNNNFWSIFYVRGVNQEEKEEVFSVTVFRDTKKNAWCIDARWLIVAWPSGLYVFPCEKAT